MSKILKNFYVFEGIDGSGKTTQMQKFAQNPHIHTTFEPTNNIIGSFIRNTILQGHKSISNEALAYLFASDRAQHLYSDDENGIIHNINLGKKVICDRYLFSSLAYQGDMAQKANQDFYLPEIVFYFDISLSQSLKRINSRNEVKHIFEKEEKLKILLEKYETVFQQYQNTGMKIIKIDALLSIDEIYQTITSYIIDSKPSDSL